MRLAIRARANAQQPGLAVSMISILIATSLAGRHDLDPHRQPRLPVGMILILIGHLNAFIVLNLLDTDNFVVDFLKKSFAQEECEDSVV